MKPSWCRIKGQIVLCYLAFISCVSMVLCYYIITNRETILERNYEDSQRGSVGDDTFCVSVWTENICLKTFENLAWFPKFPDFPDQMQCSQNLSSVVRSGMYNPAIKRTLVSFSNLEPGFYQLRVKSMLPLKVYANDNRKSSHGQNLVLVSSGSTNSTTVHNEIPVSTGNTNSRTVFSRSFFLNRNYFMEIIIFCTAGDDLLEIDWLVPGSTHFVPIQPHDLLPVVHVTSNKKPLRDVLRPDSSTLVAFIPRIHVVKGIRVCSPSDIKVWRSNPTSRSILAYSESSPLDDFLHEVLALIIASLQNVAPGKYPAYTINQLEVAQRDFNGTQTNLVLADLNMTVDGLDYFERFSEYLYVYNHGNQLEFCRPLCYQWDRSVTLSFVFLSDCSRNDMPWGLYFIENMVEFLQKSLEVDFRVIVTACHDHQRRSYESRLRNSDIDRNEVVLLEGVHQRSRAMKEVLSFVDDNNIVVLCEPRVKIPASVGEEVRKHTFKGLMGYAPTAFKLDCGYFPEKAGTKGKWCPECGGVTAMYKEDWERILSHNGDKDIMKNNKELLNYIKTTGLELIEIELRDFYSL